MIRMGSKELEREHIRAELWELILRVSECEELAMASIKELAAAHVIPVDAYFRAWEELCKAGWDMIELAEERMEAAG